MSKANNKPTLGHGLVLTESGTKKTIVMEEKGGGGCKGGGGATSFFITNRKVTNLDIISSK